MRPSSLVLLSGGLDSYASFHWASLNSDLVCGLSIDYGHKALDQEIKAAQEICRLYDVKHKVVALDFFKLFQGSSLLSQNQSTPELTEDDLDNDLLVKKTAKSVWVPNRNGIFINVAAGLAENELIDTVVVGFNAEEATTFPDNSKDYIEAANEALTYSTANKVKVVAPMADKSKKEIVEWALAQELDLSLLWSCYLGDEKMCGVCESCQRLKRALKLGKGSEWIAKLF